MSIFEKVEPEVESFSWDLSLERDFAENYERTSNNRFPQLHLVGRAAPPEWNKQLTKAERSLLYHRLPSVTSSFGNPRGGRLPLCKGIALLLVAESMNILTVYGGLRMLVDHINRIKIPRDQIPLIVNFQQRILQNQRMFFSLWSEHGRFLNAPRRILLLKVTREKRQLGIGYRDKGSPPPRLARIRQANAEFYQLMEESEPMFLAFLRTQLSSTLRKLPELDSNLLVRADLEDTIEALDECLLRMVSSQEPS